MSTFLWELLAWLAVRACAEDVDLDLSVDHTGWKDPLDPLTSSFVPGSSKSCFDELRSCRKALNALQVSSSSNSDIAVGDTRKSSDPTLKHVVRGILTRLNVDIDKTRHVSKPVMVYLSGESLATLHRFLNANEESASLREQVRIVLEDFILEQGLYVEPSMMERTSEVLRPYLPLLNVAILLPALFILIQSRRLPCSIVSLFIFVAFVVSFYNAYNRKYLQNVALRMERSQAAIDEACRPKSVWEQFANAAGGFLFIKSKSDCLTRYEDTIVDPFYEISPLDIFSEVFSSFLFTPLVTFGKHFNSFANEFYRDSPIWLNVLKTVLFAFILLCALFYISGYRIRTLFWTVEPAAPLVQRVMEPQRAALANAPTSESAAIEGVRPSTTALLSPPLTMATSCRSRKVGRSPPPCKERRATSASRVSFC